MGKICGCFEVRRSLAFKTGNSKSKTGNSKSEMRGCLHYGFAFGRDDEFLGVDEKKLSMIRGIV